MERRKTTIGGAVDECISEASEEWFRQHKGMRSREEAAGNGIKNVTGTWRRTPGGFLEVSVNIVGLRREFDHGDHWNYRLTDKAGYVRTEPKSKAAG